MNEMVENVAKAICEGEGFATQVCSLRWTIGCACGFPRQAVARAPARS
jgi:hypothetical protein